jgi:transcriptional regulator with XRE-family HTH domain
MGRKKNQNKAYYKSLGLRLRALRNKCELTLEETEERGVKSWKHLQRIESGDANITIETLLLLSHIYGVTPSAVLFGL